MATRSVKDQLAMLDDLEVIDETDEVIVVSSESVQESTNLKRPINVMIDIPFKDGEDDLKEMQAIYNNLGFEAIFMTHYQLAAGTRFSPIEWKAFLTDPRVNAFINEELELLKQQKVAELDRHSY